MLLLIGQRIIFYGKKKCIQIHRMLLLILILENTLDENERHSNTSYVAINHCSSCHAQEKTYHSNTSYVAINLISSSLRGISFHNSNTSYVAINLKMLKQHLKHRLHSNTSYVAINPIKKKIIDKTYFVFKYIVCCY